MKRCLGIILAGLVAGNAAAKKNVIIILADDISAREFPAYGSSVWSDLKGWNTSDPACRAQTPVLDQMAEQGCWIKTTWAATICSPSRAMLMTGRYAHLHKWWHNGDLGGVVQNGKKKEWVVPFYVSSPLLIGHVAQKAGYATQMVGKTQLKQCDHRLFGFDEGVFTPGSYLFPKNPHTDFVLAEVKGKKNTQINEDSGEEVQRYAQTSWYWKPSVALMNHPSVPKATAEQQITYWPVSAADKASYGLNTYGPDVELDFIFDFMERKNAEGKPFFVYHTSHLGHDQYDWLNPGSKCKWPGTPVINWDGKKYIRTEPKITGDKGEYDTHGTVTTAGIHNMINYLDYQIWQYLNKLEAMGIADDTVLIFCADNGTHGYGKGSVERQKGCHVPMFIYAPGMTKQGGQDVLVNLADLMPTVAELAGFKIPDDYEVNGESLVPFLFGDKQTHRDWIYSYKGAHQLVRGSLVMRDGNGKWWNVEKQPDDLISFPQILDWEKVSPAHRAERKKLEVAIKPFDQHATEHDFVVP
ncbi:sulfatase-like hydrolase/transferase [Pontiella sulfatireligans]|uniref:Arylsulfatase n=1 Tax=Pontiella sulfatireligans TaxID=2750658 RepID=A0A6C2UMK9_9BACT|nr:sulfatase-like hydrolase/transferase [Pontiella sulfatireligans]SPS74463.1 sulfatase S1_24 [Kiritimatiellales bacterium]VGO21512.1 Arylsulfatase [Pontiella sulfatireligans]